MKIQFQNTNTISNTKLNALAKSLDDYDLVFLSEMNKECDFGKSKKFQYHVEAKCPRIAMIATNTLNISFVEVGIVLTQKRERQDQTAVQSCIYKINQNGYEFFVENIYVVPATTAENIEKLVQHIDEMSKKFPIYSIGGDFNINWNNHIAKRRFKTISNVKQLVKCNTREKEYKTKRGIQKMSKSLIDLYFCNDRALSMVKDINVVSNLLFDHKGPVIELNITRPPVYRIVKIPIDPLQRPTPTEEQTIDIKHNINILNTEINLNYDEYTKKLRKILDNCIPTNKRNNFKTVKIYRIPYSLSIKKQIYLKRKYYKNRKKDEKCSLLYKKQRNKLSLLLRKERKSYFDYKLAKCSSAEKIEKRIKFLQVGSTANLNSTNESALEIEGVSGYALAVKIAIFYKERAENLVSDNEMSQSNPPHSPLRDNENLKKTLKFNFPRYEKLSEFIPKKKISKTAGPNQISSSIVDLFWPEIKIGLNNICRNYFSRRKTKGIFNDQ